MRLAICFIGLAVLLSNICCLFVSAQDANTNYVVLDNVEPRLPDDAVDTRSDVDYSNPPDYETTIRPLPRSGNYRIEVDFQHFENTHGIRHDGQYCDYFTNCDPTLKAMIDIEKPLLPFPGSATNPADFRVLAVKKDSNGFAVNNKVYRTVCNRSVFPTAVTARVDVHDFDTFSNNDQLEQFDCRFPFRPFRNGTERGDGWSETRQCDATHQPSKIKLSYRWRIVPISAAQCRMQTSPVSVAQVVQVPASGYTPPQDSQDFFGRVYGYIRSAMEFVGDLSKVVRSMTGRGDETTQTFPS